MPATILYRDDDMLERNNEVMGSNRIRYMPWINTIIGAERNHSDGTLKEADYKDISFDAVQKFPEDQLAKILKPAQTEIATVDINSKEFRYNRVVQGVKMVISNLRENNTVNAKASIMNSLLKQWDYMGYVGAYGNLGIKDNPNQVKGASVAITDIKTLISAISDGIEAMKKQIDITDNELGGLKIGYTSQVASVLAQVFQDGSTGRDLLAKAFPSPEKGEIPSSISNSYGDGVQFVELYYKPMVTQHHGAIPSEYANEDGEFGLSKKTLFTYESVGFDLEEKGCVYHIPLTF